MADDEYPRFNPFPNPKKPQGIYTDRLRQFTDPNGLYKSFNLTSVLEFGRTSDKENITLEVYSVPNLARPLFKDAIKNEFTPTRKGVAFGPSWSTHWFKVNVKIPKEWTQYDAVELQWDGGNEGMIYDTSGSPLQGLSGNGERIRWIIPKEWKDDEWHLFYIEASCNGMFGNGVGSDNNPPDPNRYFTLAIADLVAPNLVARALALDFWVIGDAAREFPQDSWQKHKALAVANEIMNVFDPKDPQTLYEARRIAKTYLGCYIDSDRIYKTAAKSYVYGIGHCHIDTAWLWPFAETRRKTARSWSNQLELMDRYPEHRFACSQAQQYKWLKQDYPKLFERIKLAVDKGQFEYIGGSWVENDTNMPSGESLVRQFLLGQRFFEGNFGKRSTTFWLPDTFGYSGQIPQFCRLAGMDRFLTQKLSWNNIDVFPNTTFNWAAIDGSQVLCHMPPANTYTADANFGDVNRSLSQHKNLADDQIGMLVFGKGDGGGGPTDEMLEKLRRCRGVSDSVGLLPAVEMGKTVDQVYDLILSNTDNGRNLVSWVGELYLEFHRGTYTTQADIKKGNRDCEILLHDLELVATLASLSNSDFKYPKKEIDDLWEVVCLNQFHDVLPGSSIEMVYDDAKAMHRQVLDKGEKLLSKAHDALGDINDSSGASVYLDLLPWSRPAFLTLGEISEEALIQRNVNGGKLSLINRKEPPQKCWIEPIGEGKYILSNSQLCATINNGHLASLIFLPTGQEVIPENCQGNRLVIYDDKPLYFDAWDFEVYSQDTKKYLETEITSEVIEEGPLRVALKTKQRISEDSWITTQISLSAFSETTSLGSYVEFESQVEWHESHKFLKVEFPVDLRNDFASYECQFGLVRRPTHANTSWDAAKFEVCSHKFADYSESNFGVSILNDSKYGFITRGNLMQLSLLRSPKAPDGHADMGRHKFRYAILPHLGPVNASVVKAGYEFNHQVRKLSKSRSKYNFSVPPGEVFQVTGSDSVILSNVKRGEDDGDLEVDDGLPKRSKDTKSVILRLYEALGGKSAAKILTPLKVAKAFKTNILEDDLEEIEVTYDANRNVYEIPVKLRAFEIASYRLEI